MLHSATIRRGFNAIRKQDAMLSSKPKRLIPEAANRTEESLLSFSEIEPELNYITGVLFGVLAEFHEYTLDDPAKFGVDTGWNILDAISSFITSGLYFAQCYKDYKNDITNPHQKEFLAKATALFVSGAEVFGLTLAGNSIGPIAALSGAALGPLSFAFAMLIDFGIAIKDLAKAEKRASFEGWLEDSVEEVAYLNEKISKEAKNSPMEQAKLQKKKEQLVQDIAVRTKVYCNDKHCENEIVRDARKRTVQITFNKVEHKIFQKNSTLSAMKFQTDIKTIKTESAITKPKVMLTEKDIQRNNRLQKQAKCELHEKRVNCLFKGLSFVGMTFLAIPFPPLQAAGLAIVSVVGAYYLLKNASKLVNKVESWFAKKPICDKTKSASALTTNSILKSNPTPANNSFFFSVPKMAC